MKRPRRKNPMVIALWANAVVLVGILIVLLSRSNSPSFLPSAFGQNQAPIAGGAGIFVMPAQLASNVWGCYLLDVDSHTLVAYQYEPGNRQLHFVAARSYEWDRFLKDINTTPPTEDIHRLVDRQRQGLRQPAGAAPPGNPAVDPAVNPPVVNPDVPKDPN
jgi:hypothetical protein